MSWVEVLRKMRSELNQMGFDQIPQLTSSRMIDVNKPMRIVPPDATGHRRAILIGINYIGQQGQLSGKGAKGELKGASERAWYGCKKESY